MQADNMHEEGHGGKNTLRGRFVLDNLEVA